MRRARGRPLTDRDRAEMDRFRRFLALQAEKLRAPGVTREAATRAAHAEVYGEQVYPKPG